jgi:hypothetical protein
MKCCESAHAGQHGPGERENVVLVQSMMTPKAWQGVQGLMDAVDILQRENARLTADRDAAVRAETERCRVAIAKTYGPWRIEWTPAENLAAWKRALLTALAAP